MKAMSEDKFIKVNEIEIYFTDSGKGDIPIIFIHGFPFDKSIWKPQEEFLNLFYRVITYDIRGYGNSIVDKKNPTIDLYADDLISFMNAMHIEKAIVCGLSMGGYILLNAVNRYPDKFEALILADTQCIADSSEVKEKRKTTIQQIEDKGLEDFAKAFVGNVFCRESLVNKSEIVGQIQNIILSTQPESITGTLSALAGRVETCSILNNIKIPVLILCGREDNVTPLKQSEFLQNSLPGSVFHIIDKAGHLSNLEQPDIFNKYIKEFITGISNQ